MAAKGLGNCELPGGAKEAAQIAEPFSCSTLKDLEPGKCVLNITSYSCTIKNFQEIKLLIHHPYRACEVKVHGV
jgi:hypothetical protein